MIFPGLRLEFPALCQQRDILFGMRFGRSHEFDRAVPMLVVIPMHQLRHAVRCCHQIFKGNECLIWTVFQGFK